MKRSSAGQGAPAEATCSPAMGSAALSEARIQKRPASAQFEAYRNSARCSLGLKSNVPCKSYEAGNAAYSTEIRRSRLALRVHSSVVCVMRLSPADTLRLKIDRALA